MRLFAEAPSLDPEVALRRFVENALGARPAGGARRRALRAQRGEPARSGRLAGAGGRRPGLPGRRRRDHRADTDPRAAPPTTSSTTATRRCSPRGSRARASSCSKAPGTCSSGSGRTSPSGSSTSSSDEPAHHRQDHPRPRPDHTRSGSRLEEAGRTWTYAELDARSDELAARPLARRSRLDAHRQLGRARRAHVRVREGGRDPASDLVAPGAGRGRLPARRRRAGGLPDRGRVPRARRGGARARERPARSDARAEPAQRAGRESRTTTRCSSSTRPARPASPRARCSRTRTASGRTSRSISRPGSGPTTSSCRCCRSSTAAGGTCSRSSRGGKARRSCSSAASTRRARSS